jgi:hypothetical protein
MEREDILRVLRAHPDNCIRGYNRGHPLGTGRTEGRVLVRHYGGLIPDEIVLTPVMFLKVQDLLYVSETWGTASLGGCTWRLAETTRGPLGKRKISYAKPVFCTDH